MNKLYIIKFLLPNGYFINTWSAWNEKNILEKIKKNPEWKFKVVENNDIHKIWHAE